MAQEGNFGKAAGRVRSLLSHGGHHVNARCLSQSPALPDKASFTREWTSAGGALSFLQRQLGLACISVASDESAEELLCQPAGHWLIHVAKTRCTSWRMSLRKRHTGHTCNLSCTSCCEPGGRPSGGGSVCLRTLSRQREGSPRVNARYGLGCVPGLLGGCGQQRAAV